MKLILAPPGAGKTRLLVEHVQQLLEGGVSPFRIMATTYSREGARELSERLGEDVPVRTVHSLALWVVRVTARARGSAAPRVISAEQAQLYMERAVQAAVAEQAGAKFVEPGQVLSELAAVRERGISLDGLHPASRAVAEHYLRLLQEEHRMDFTGILEQARAELQDSDFQNFIGGLHLLVDEGQDLNYHTEWPVLEGFRRAAEELVMMASPSQQIYTFKGANWEALSALFPDNTEISSLEHNYRSTPEIIAASRLLAGPDARHMRAVRPSLRLPVIAAGCLEEALEVDYIGQTLSAWLSAGLPARQIALLTRTHALHDPLQTMLRDRGIPYQMVADRPDLYSREEVQAVSAFLDLALHPSNELVLEQVINVPPVGIGTRMRYRLRGDGRLRWKHLEAAVEHLEEFPPQLTGRIARLLSFRAWSGEILASRDGVPDQLERLLALTDLPDYLENEADFSALHALSELARLAGEFNSLAAFHEYLALEIERPRPSEGVQLSTLHAAKGREWQAVILPNFQEGILPLRKMKRADEQNLAFVGLTRARDRLVMTYSRTSAPSPFLSGMALEEVRWP